MGGGDASEIQVLSQAVTEVDPDTKRTPGAFGFGHIVLSAGHSAGMNVKTLHGVIRIFSGVL